MLDLIDVGIGDPSKFKVIPPGLRINALLDKDIARKKLGLNPDAFQCAFIGRVTQIKRPDRFLDVVKESKNRNFTRLEVWPYYKGCLPCKGK